MDVFLGKIMGYADQHALLSPGDRIVVGLSGGADSVCLLLALQVLSVKLPLSLCAVHVEHGIRGQEALEDAAFCRQLCETRGIPFREVHCAVPERARREGLSLEEAGRKARYETFAQVLEAWGGTKIAVAHHREDQAETLLLHLFRGTHLAGMQGMRPRQEVIIRPLLDTSREEIEQWLCQQGVFWRTDSTNLTDDYARNRVRHRILPEARQINSAATEHLAETCGAIGEVMDYMEAEAEKLYLQCRIERPTDAQPSQPVAGDGHVGNDCGVSPKSVQKIADKFSKLEQTNRNISTINVNRQMEQQEFANGESVQHSSVTLDAGILASVPPVLARFVLKKAYMDCCGQCKDVGAVHYAALMGLLSGETGKRLDLPHGVCAEKNYDRLTLYTTKRQKKQRDNRIQGGNLDREKLICKQESQNILACNCGKSGDVRDESMELIAKAPSEGEGSIGQSPEYVLLISGVTDTPNTVFPVVSLPDGGQITITLEDFKKGAVIPIKTYTKWMDYDTIKGSLMLRTRRPGDYLVINEQGGRKKLKDYFIDEKIERRERDRMWLLADGSHVLWVIGGRMSVACRVTERTEKVLKIHADGGVWNE